MKMQNQMDKNDWHGPDMIFKRKICICSARKPSLAIVTKKELLKISSYFIFVHWQGAGRSSKFAWYMKKWKNKEHSSLPKSITERTMFFKMQNFPVFGLFRISTSGNEKKL